ncbi:MAG TPA: TetR family transcriptional regulator [Micromonosporaceae bacterium]|nr:TetR family transcriptional regulator [Micromonosporaceae bacterium]HCU50142.1 TetR family transcriptional regulator [Micromonosporaceae bacterium]
MVDAALSIIDERGLDALTLAAVASRTGVAAPSLYKHIGSLGELRELVSVRLLEEMAERFTAVAIGRSRDDAVAALMREYRAFVMESPNRYAAMPSDPLHDPALAVAGMKLLNVILAVLRGYGLEKEAAIHATRCLRVIVHGFADIEASGGFGLPEDLDESYEQLIRMFLASLPRNK